MTGDLDQARSEYQTAIASLIGTVPDAVEHEILIKAAELLRPRVYRAARKAIPPASARYAIASRFIGEALAELSRPARRDEET